MNAHVISSDPNRQQFIFLTGLVSNKPIYRYELFLHPNFLEKTAAFVGKAKRKEGETKKWKVTCVNPPTPFDLVNIADAIFRKKPSIEITKRQGKRHLTLEFGKKSPSLYPVSIAFDVVMSHQGKEYKVIFNPQVLKETRAFSRDEKATTNQGTEVEVRRGALRNCKVKKFRKELVSKLDTLIRLKEDRGRTWVYFSTKKIKQTASNTFLQKRSEQPFFAVQNSRDLANYLANPNVSHKELAIDIAAAIVTLFTNQQLPSKKAISEITALFEHVENHDQFRILNTLLSTFNLRSLEDEEVLEALGEILKRLQKMNYRKTFAEAANFSQNDFFISSGLEKLDATHLVRILESLTTHLNHVSVQKRASSLIKKQLVVMLTLLELMVSLDVENIHKNTRDEAYKALGIFKRHENVEVRFLAHSGRQCFRLIKDSVSSFTTCSNLAKRGFYLGRAIAKTAEAVSLYEPWHIADIFGALTDYDKALHFHPKFLVGKKWDFNLFCLRTAIEQSPSEFPKFAEKLKQGDKEIRDKINLRHPFFVIGFINLLWEILHSNFPSENRSIKKAAISLLGHIYEVNGANKKHAVKQTFQTKKGKREQIQEIVRGYLWTCSTHPQLELSDEAMGLIKDLGIVRQDKIVPFVAVDEPKELFDAVLEREGALLKLLHRIKKTQDLDEPFKKERNYFIVPDLREDDVSKNEPLQDRIESFLSGSSPMLEIEGPGGSGKTITMKMLADVLLHNHSPENHLPFYVFLPDLEDPLSGVLDKIRKDYGIDKSLEDKLKELPTVVFCDALDEVDLKKLREVKKKNFFRYNLFSTWPKLKVVVTCKPGLVKHRRFQPEHAELQTALMAPFDANKILNYLTQFVAEYELERESDPQIPPLLWDIKQYHENFKKLHASSIGKVFENPLHLKIGAIVVPFIVEKIKKKHPDMELEDMFQDDEIGVFERKLYQAYACFNAYRSYLKVRDEDVTPEDYLKFSADVAKMMEDHQIFNLPWPLEDFKVDDENTKKIIQSNFAKYLKQEKICKECLVLRREGWGFMHKQYRIYFVTLKQDSDELQAVLEAYKKYDFKTLFGNQIRFN